MRALALIGVLIAACPHAWAGDLDAGKQVYKKCQICHSIGPDVKKKPGPQLNGVIGRQWGAIEDFKYSGGRDGTLLAIHEAEPRIWDVATLTAYLRKPKDVIPKGKMVFPGLKKDADIENVIFYLAAFDADGNEADPAAVLAASEGGSPDAGGASNQETPSN